MKKLLKKIYSYEKAFSEKNGQINIYRTFGVYEIGCGGCFQSGPYVNRLWRKVLRGMPRKFGPRSILLLGLGAGGAVGELTRKYPKARIKAVEYDPVMIEIAKKTFLKKVRGIELDIVEMDALEYVKKMEEQFDVIVLDLFNGKNPADFLTSPDFLRTLQSRLSKKGYLLVNFFGHKKEMAPVFEQYFSLRKNLRYSFNKMAIYRHFWLGDSSDPVIPEYINKEQALSYQKAQINFPKIESLVESAGILGIKRRFRFFEMESYFSKNPPEVVKVKKTKVVFWQPLSSRDVPSGWRKALFVNPPYQNGIAKAKEGYWEDWSENARRGRKRFLSGQEGVIFEAKPEEFIVAYQKCGKLNPVTRSTYIRGLKRLLEVSGENVRLYLVRNQEGGDAFAGLAVVHYPDVSISAHYISFINKGVKKTSAGFGLIDYWHQDCLKRGIRFLNFGIVWRPGYPRAWRGYSRFKKQFNLKIIRYPRMRFKIRLR